MNKAKSLLRAWHAHRARKQYAAYLAEAVSRIAIRDYAGTMWLYVDGMPVAPTADLSDPQRVLATARRTQAAFRAYGRAAEAAELNTQKS